MRHFHQTGHTEPDATEVPKMCHPLLSTGAKGLELIENFESLRLKRYLDSAQRPTIGYGHLILPDETFEGAITLAKAQYLLQHDLGISERGVRIFITVPLTQNQFDALVSFTLNLGIGSLKHSTLRHLLNQKRYHPAAEEFLRWDRAGGVIVPGLARRRRAERALFLEP